MEKKFFMLKEFRVQLNEQKQVTLLITADHYINFFSNGSALPLGSIYAK
jgi:hypothetical protein